MNLTLRDGTAYELDPASSISAVILSVDDVESVPGILRTFEDGNLETVRLDAGGRQSRHFNLHMVSASLAADRLTVCLAERDETALRLDELDAAIVELAGMIAGEE